MPELLELKARTDEPSDVPEKEEDSLSLYEKTKLDEIEAVKNLAEIWLNTKSKFRYSNREISEKTGIPTSSVNRHLNGKSRLPIEWAKKYAILLHINIADIYPGATWIHDSSWDVDYVLLEECAKAIDKFELRTRIKFEWRRKACLLIEMLRDQPISSCDDAVIAANERLRNNSLK